MAPWTIAKHPQTEKSSRHGRRAQTIRSQRKGLPDATTTGKRKSKEGFGAGQTPGEGTRQQTNKIEDMSATEQQVLEDFETEKLSKQYKNACGKRVHFFRDKRNDA